MTTPAGKKEAEKPKSRLEILEEVVSKNAEALVAVVEKVEALEKAVTELGKAAGKPKGLFGGKRERVAIKDTKTGTVYISKAACGKALATEAGTDPLDHFAYYKLTAKFPDRFIDASPEEKEIVEKAEAEAKAEWEAEQAAEAAKAGESGS